LEKKKKKRKEKKNISAFHSLNYLLLHRACFTYYFLKFYVIVSIFNVYCSVCSTSMHTSIPFQMWPLFLYKCLCQTQEKERAFVLPKLSVLRSEMCNCSDICWWVFELTVLTLLSLQYLIWFFSIKHFDSLFFINCRRC